MEEQGKLFRLALEAAKIDKHLAGNYKNLSQLDSYKTALALEQDAKLVASINSVNSVEPHTLMGNTEPSLGRDPFEGATTRVYGPGRIMKPILCKCIGSAEHREVKI